MKAKLAQINQKYSRQGGLSIVELMVSLSIGLLLLTGLASLFIESGRSHRELSEASKQIESGRYAIQLLTDDFHLTGFYGRFTNFPVTPTVAPDPCALGDTTTLYNAIPIYIQGYNAASFTTRPVVSNLCSAILTNANLLPGSDVFAIRRADTRELGPAELTEINQIYTQGNELFGEIQKATGAVTIGTTKRADGCMADGTSGGGCGTSALLNKDGTAATVRKYHVHVYFVAPCSIPAGGGASCTGSADDGGKPIPTLKRLELTAVGGVTAMNIVSLVEGIEMLKIDYGWDSDKDGSPNSPALKTVAAAADWANILSVKLSILSRNPQLTAGYVDSKTYDMGLSGVLPAPGDNFKRHVYKTSVRLTNPGMRCERGCI